MIFIFYNYIYSHLCFSNLKKKIIFLFLSLILFIHPYPSYASHTPNPYAEGLKNRISNNFSRRYCKAIDSGFSKDEAMRSAIIETENIVAFSLNPQKKNITKEDLADQISIQVINKCGWSFGLVGKDGISYFIKYDKK